MLRPAINDASWILKTACIKVVWIHCAPVNRSNVAICQAPAGALELHILSVPATNDFHEDTLGIAIPHVGAGDRAATFLSRVRETADRNAGIADLSVVLGVAMAHELGHLLLHSASHSSEGVMRADLRPDDLKRASQRRLRFTQEQCEAIGRNLASTVLSHQ